MQKQLLNSLRLAGKAMVLALFFVCATLVAEAGCPDITWTNNTSSPVTIEVIFDLDGGGTDSSGTETLPENCFISCPSGANCTTFPANCPGYRSDAEVQTVLVNGQSFSCCGVFTMANGDTITITRCSITFD